MENKESQQFFRDIGWALVIVTGLLILAFCLGCSGQNPALTVDHPTGGVYTQDTSRTVNYAADPLTAVVGIGLFAIVTCLLIGAIYLPSPPGFWNEFIAAAFFASSIGLAVALAYIIRAWPIPAGS